MRTRLAAIGVTAALGVGLLAALPALPASAKSISSSNLKALFNTLN